MSEQQEHIELQIARRVVLARLGNGEPIAEIMADLGGAEGNRPSQLDLLADSLIVENQALLDRVAVLTTSFGKMPTVVDNEDVAGRAGDLKALITAALASCETARDARKAPFRQLGAAVDGFFKKKIAEPLEDAKAEINKRLRAYLIAKEDRERAERIEAERRARAAADEARARAAEAERELNAAAEKQAATQREADQRKREEDQKLADAVAAEQHARQAEADARAATKAATAKPADLVRTRGDMGSVSTLAKVWKFADLDRSTIDLERLRPYFTTDDIEKAIRAAIKAGAREIRGCRIYDDRDVR